MRIHRDLLYYLYDVLKAVQYKIGYALKLDALLNDLVLMRIFEPTSKLRSIELMEKPILASNITANDFTKQ